MDDILAAAAPPAAKAKRATKKGPRTKGTLTRSTPIRGPGGKFVSGRTYAPSQVEVYSGTGEFRGIGTVPGGVGISKSARVRNIRKQRAGVLAALREAKARGLRDGTIKRLKEASRQLLHRSQLARGL